MQGARIKIDLVSLTTLTHLNINSITSNKMSRPLLAKEIQVENIKYGQVKKSPSGAKSVYISYNGEKFVIQFMVNARAFAASLRCCK